MNLKNNQNKIPKHIPVLASEVIDLLKIKENRWYVDATTGGGGHTGKIIAAGGKVIGFEQNEQAYELLQIVYKAQINQKKLILIKNNFRNMKKQLQEQGFNYVDGVLFDLGISTDELQSESRGFSFQIEAPLDMRMSHEMTNSAADLINTASLPDLTDIFMKYGEELFAKEIAQAIVEQRKKQPFSSTDQLRELIYAIYRSKHALSGIHPATKVFQALRIWVNDEIGALQEALPQSVDLLVQGGVCCVISFHSLEDRVVKRFIDTNDSIAEITKRPIMASVEEKRVNSASRSAKLRAFKKI